MTDDAHDDVYEDAHEDARRDAYDDVHRDAYDGSYDGAHGDPLDEEFEAAAEAASDPDFDGWDAFESPSPELSVLLGQLRRLQDVAKRHTRGRQEPSADLGLEDTWSLSASSDPKEWNAWGPLEIREKIGAGANGEIFRAFDPKLQREVALKLQPAGQGRSERVLAEARRLARVRHANVISIHGADVSEGYAGIWTDLLSGETLDDQLRREGPMGEVEAASIAVDLCRALHAVHRSGLVHGDVKTANVMSEEDGSIVLLDFGSGRMLAGVRMAEAAVRRGDSSDAVPEDAVESGPASLGETSIAISGTPIAMAPELFSGDDPSPQSDIYALGALLHRLVLGTYPIEAATVEALVERHLSGAVPAALEEDDGSVSPELRSVFRLSLSAEPSARYASAREMEAALLPIVSRRSGDPRMLRRATCPNNVPRPISRLIGRDREISEVRDLCRRARLVTLIGTGGSGKTRLATEVSASFLTESLDEVRFVELSNLDASSRVLPTLGEALGVRDPGTAPWIDAIEKRLRGRKALLVLDNAEHLLTEIASVVQQMLSRTTELQVICTSREALGIFGERVYSVPPLTLPPAEATAAERATANLQASEDVESSLESAPRTNLTLEEMRQVESVRLFLDRAEAAGATISWDEDSAGAVAEICRRLDGIPLAIELAAVRTASLSLRDIVSGLAHRLELFTSRGVVPRHQTLDALIGWSHDLLSDSERSTLRRLAVFVGGWNVESARAICHDDEVPQKDDVHVALTRLVERQLLEVDVQRSRYRMLESVHAFALRELERSGEVELVDRRHREYFLDFIRRAKSNLRRPDEPLWMHRVRDELDNIRVAFAGFGLRADSESGSDRSGPVSIDDLERLEQLTSDFVQMGYAIGAWRETLELGRQVLGLPGGKRLAASRCDLLHSVMNVEMQRAEFEVATRHLEEALEIATHLWETEKDELRLSRTHGYFGNLTYAQGQNAKAKAYQTKALAAATAAGDIGRIAIVLSNLGNILEVEADYDGACRCQTESIEAARKVGDQRSVAYSYCRLGEMLAATSRFDESIEHFEKSLSIRRSIGDLWGLAVCLSGLGGVFWRQGEFDRGRRLLEESLEILEELGDRNSFAKIQTNLGLAYYDRKELDASEVCLFKAIESAWEISELRDIAIAFLVLSSIHLDRGHPGVAAVLLGACEALDRDCEWTMPQANYDHHAQESERCVKALGEAAEAEFQKGREMPVRDAIEFAMRANA